LVAGDSSDIWRTKWAIALLIDVTYT